MLRYRLSEICLTAADVNQSKQYHTMQQTSQRDSWAIARSRIDYTSLLPQLRHGSERSRDEAVVHIGAERISRAQSAELVAANGYTISGKEALVLNLNSQMFIW